MTECSVSQEQLILNDQRTQGQARCWVLTRFLGELGARSQEEVHTWRTALREQELRGGPFLVDSSSVRSSTPPGSAKPQTLFPPPCTCRAGCTHTDTAQHTALKQETPLSYHSLLLHFSWPLREQETGSVGTQPHSEDKLASLRRMSRGQDGA